MQLPPEATIRDLMRLPWSIVTGTTEDGTPFAKCAEIPHAVAFAEPGEDLDSLYWDSLRASLEAILAAGEPLPRPKALRPPLAAEPVVSIVAHINETLRLEAPSSTTSGVSTEDVLTGAAR